MWQEIHGHNLVVKAQYSALTQFHLQFTFLLCYELVDMKHRVDRVLYTLLISSFLEFASVVELLYLVVFSLFYKAVNVVVVRKVGKCVLIFVALDIQTNFCKVIVP